MTPVLNFKVETVAIRQNRNNKKKKKKKKEEEKMIGIQNKFNYFIQL